MTDEVKRGRPPKTDEQIEEKKKGTRPGWRPSSVLPQLKARTGFTARWVRNESGNIAKKLAEGWVVMKTEDNVGIPIISTETPDSNSLTNAIRYRDQIAMMISDDDKAARDEYLKRENAAVQRSILHKSDEQFKQMGS